MLALLTIAGLLLVGVTLAPLSWSRVWWIRGFDFPRLQFSLAALVLLVLEASFLDLGRPAGWVLLGVTLLCLGYQAWWILPYTRLFPTEVRLASEASPRRTLRVMVANVLAPNRRSEALIGLVRDHEPDLLVTLESDGWWEAQLTEIEDDYPHTIKCPLDNLYGMHVFSRLPLCDALDRARPLGEGLRAPEGLPAEVRARLRNLCSPHRTGSRGSGDHGSRAG